MTGPDDVRDAVGALAAGAADALGDRLAGVYLVGSFALGAADGRSDVDTVVVADGRPQGPALDDLRALHARLPDAGGWSARLEVSYADLADLRSPMTLGRAWPHVDDGAREVGSSARDNTAHARWVLRERGVVVTGSEPRVLVAEVTPEALRAEALGLARARAEELEDDPSPYADAWWQPRYVLTSCRTAWTATHGAVTSGPEAARWALDALDPVHRPVVERALRDRTHPTGPTGPTPGRPGDPGLVAPTRALVWDVVRVAGTVALEARSSPRTSR